MRVEIGSKHTSSGSSAVQFFTSERPYLTSIRFQPSYKNNNETYVGTDSGVGLTKGIAFSMDWPAEPLEIVATVKATTYWMNSDDTAAVVNYVAVFEY